MSARLLRSRSAEPLLGVDGLARGRRTGSWAKAATKGESGSLTRMPRSRSAEPLLGVDGLARGRRTGYEAIVNDSGPGFRKKPGSL